MITTSRRSGPVLSLAATILLVSCGGGGSSAPSTPVNPATPIPTATPTQAPTTCASVASLAAGSTTGRMPARAASGGVVPNRLYVSYRTSSATRGASSIDRAVSSVRGMDLGNDGGVAHRALTLAPGSDDAQATAALRATAGVVDVQPVHYRSSLAVDQYDDNVNQWYLFKTAVNPTAWSFGTQGAGVSVAVIDTGVDETNADMNAKFDVRERVVGGAVTTGAGSVQESIGQVSIVAGLATAQTNNSYGFAGVGYNVHLQFYKIFPDATATSDCQQADTADEARAIRDAVANGASVINLSLGSPQSAGTDVAEANAVAFAISNNVTVVAAAGNESGSVPDLPGGLPGVIAVGASNVQNAVANTYGSIVTEGVASYSNSGPTLVAPGGDPQVSQDPDLLHWIEGYSTTTAALPADRCTNSGGVCRVLFAGTSQATPQVAGTVALMMSYHGGPRSLTPGTVANLLTTTADSIGLPAARQGAGRLNAGRAVAAAHP